MFNRISSEMAMAQEMEPSRNMFLFSSNIGMNPHGGYLYKPPFLGHTRLSSELFHTSVIPMTSSAQYGMFRVMDKYPVTNGAVQYLLRIAFARVEDDVVYFIDMSNRLLNGEFYKIVLPDNDFSRLSLGGFYPIVATGTRYSMNEGYKPISYGNFLRLIDTFHGKGEVHGELGKVMVDTLMDIISNRQPLWMKEAISISLMEAMSTAFEE